MLPVYSDSMLHFYRISVRYGGHESPLEGTTSAYSLNFEVPPGQYITIVFGKHDTKINAIQFTTNEDVCSDYVGGAAGSFFYTPASVGPLLFISGGADSDIQYLIFHYGCM